MYHSVSNMPQFVNNTSILMVFIPMCVLSCMPAIARGQPNTLITEASTAEDSAMQKRQETMHEERTKGESSATRQERMHEAETSGKMKQNEGTTGAGSMGETYRSGTGRGGSGSGSGGSGQSDTEQHN
jgi:hypothetical protein